MTWLTDSRNNKCAVEHFGSKEAAQKALDSLIECDYCTNCSGCSGCSDLKNARPAEADKPARSFGPPAISVVEGLHRKIYEAASQPEALAMTSWHTCEKKHCRAGWVIALAGEEGRKLEAFFNTELAAMKIYDASCPDYKINPARFYDTDEAAIVDMKALAEKAAAQNDPQPA